MVRYGLLAILLCAQTGAAEPAVSAWLQRALEKVEKNQPPPQNPRPLLLQAARNEYESFQLALRGSLPAGTALEFGDLAQSSGARIRAEHIVVRLARSVSFWEPADPARKYDRLRYGRGAANQWVKRETPDLLENETGFTYDAGSGVKRGHLGAAVSTDANMVFWITLRVPPEAAPGDYEGRIHVGAGPGGQTLAYQLKVWNFTLPKFASFQLSADPPRHGPRYSRSFADQDFFSHRATLRHLGVDPELSFDKNDQPVIVWNEFDRRAAYIIGELGMRGFQVPYAYVVGGHGDVQRNLRPGLKEGEYAGMLTFGGYLGVPYYPQDRQFARYYDPKRGGEDGMDDTFKRRFRNYLAAFARHTKEKGWFNALVVNVFDEPTERSYGQLRSLSRLAREADPDYRVSAMGVLPTPELVGYFQVWNGYYRPNQRDLDVDFIHRRQDAGETVRTGNPWYDWMINRSPVWVRAYLWWAWVERVDGAGSFTIAEWRDLKLDGEGNLAPESNLSPESSWSVMVYPPAKGSDQYRSSVRWEMTREGLEDYEFFVLFRDKLQQRGRTAAQAREEVTRLLSQVIRPGWARVEDLDLMERIRVQIAREIEK